MSTFLTEASTMERQNVLSAVVDIDYTDFNTGGKLAAATTTGDVIKLLTLPSNAIVTFVNFSVLVAFVPGTIVGTMSVGDGTAVDTYIAATDFDTTGGSVATTVATTVPIEYTAEDAINLVLGGTVLALGAATAGKVRVTVNYIQKGRCNEVHE